ncbi:MAG: GyrI-like domain-containing protein [Hyphomicrobiales bacterium]|nr:GyrI-like domain-containing protein [Hyphomicrobiales bacterium]
MTLSAALLALVALMALMALWSPDARAAAPVLDTPRTGLPGKTTPLETKPLETKPSGLPAPTLPGQDKDKAGSGPDGAHDHDHNAKGPSVIETVKVPALPALVRSSKATWEKGYAAIRSAVAELRSEATRANLVPKGRPLVIYIENNDQDFRFDVMLPLASEPAANVKLSNGFRFGHNPGGKAMKFEHRSAYADIESTYEAITAYLDDKGMSAREFFIEEIINDVADPADIKAAVNIYVFLK